jgi:hypothetical protein
MRDQPTKITDEKKIQDEKSQIEPPRKINELFKHIKGKGSKSKDLLASWRNLDPAFKEGLFSIINDMEKKAERAKPMASCKNHVRFTKNSDQITQAAKTMHDCASQAQKILDLVREGNQKNIETYLQTFQTGPKQAARRIEAAYKSALAFEGNKSVSKELKMAKNSWKSIVYKWKGEISNQVNNIMQNSRKEAAKMHPNLITFFYELQDSDTFNETRHILRGDRNVFQRLSQDAKSLLKQYTEFVSEIIPFEDLPVRNAPINRRADIISEMQHSPKTTRAKISAIRFYTGHDYTYIFAFNRCSGDPAEYNRQARAI